MNRTPLLDIPNASDRLDEVRRLIESSCWKRQLQPLCEHGGRITHAKPERVTLDTDSVPWTVDATLWFTEAACIGCCTEPVDYPGRAKLRFKLDPTTCEIHDATAVDCDG